MWIVAQVPYGSEHAPSKDRLAGLVEAEQTSVYQDIALRCAFRDQRNCEEHFKKQDSEIPGDYDAKCFSECGAWRGLLNVNG
jgi:hypothetical protein